MKPLFTSYLIIFLTSLVGSFVVSNLCLRSKHSWIQQGWIVFPSTIFAILASVGLYYVDDFSDFITNLSLQSIIMPLSVVALTACIYPLKCRFVFQSIFFIVAATVTVISFPSAVIDFSPTIPTWGNIVLTISVWLAATFSLRILKGLPVLTFMQTSTLAGGVAILSLISGLPQIFGIIGFAFLAISLAYLPSLWNGSEKTLSSEDCDLLGYICGWIIVFSSAEAAGPCISCFCMYWIIETLWSVGLKLTFMPQYSNIINNSLYNKALQTDLPPNVVYQFISKQAFIALLFGTFEVYAPNRFSMPVFTALILSWNLYRLITWKTSTASIKETNKQVIEEIRDSVDLLKNNFKRK